MVCVKIKTKMELFLNQKEMLVLASSSPRRKQLLALGGWAFKLSPAQIDETPLPDEDPRAYVLRLSEGKAKVAAQMAGSDAVVIGADTTVVFTPDLGKPQILGKPADPAEAVAMLRLLRNRTHQVCTGMAVLDNRDGRLLTDLASTDVHMRDYSDAEMAAYIATGDPLDKAGAYAIQHPEFNPVDKIQGCYTNIVGLPVCHLVRLLQEIGVPPRSATARGAKPDLYSECSVCSQVMKGEM